MPQDTEFNITDVREFITDQLNKDLHRDGYLSIDEYRQFMFQITQVEIAEQLRRIATALELLERR